MQKYMQKNKFAIIVPYRDRPQHLMKFNAYMKVRFINADIFVIEQADQKPFNRGKLLNIGFLEAEGYDYYALHDVDMLPVKSDYSKPEWPTLLATKVQQFGYKMPFDEYFGGVVLITGEQMKQCNGYHNEFWGWGGEDNSFRDRILATVGKIEKRDCTYNSLQHQRKIDNKLHQKNCDLWQSGVHLENGLSNCNYEVISRDNNIIKVVL